MEQAGVSAGEDRELNLAELEQVTGGGFIDQDTFEKFQGAFTGTQNSAKVDMYEELWGTLSARAVVKLVGAGPLPKPGSRRP